MILSQETNGWQLAQSEHLCKTNLFNPNPHLDSRDINLWEETTVSDKGEIHNRRSWSMTSHHIEQ
jgi:hypothetical protein